jgi:isopenicillin-N epimerase
MNAKRYGRDLLPLWALRRDMRFLNHGSFGATPKCVLEAQRALRERMEAQPVEFLAGQLAGELRAAAGRQIGRAHV